MEIEWLTSLVLWLAGDRLAVWWRKYVQMPWWQYVEMSWWSARSWWVFKGQWWWHSTGLWWVMFVTGMTAPFVWFGLLCRAFHHDMAFPEETAAGVAVIAVAIAAALSGLWIWLPSETFIKILQTHGVLVGLCLACILCRHVLPRPAYEFVRLAAGWSPVLALAMALSWYGYARLGLRWPFGFLVLAAFAFTSHLCSKINQRNTAIRQQLAAELAAYHARREKLMEEFNPSVIGYTPEETDAYQKNLAWFENKTPEPSWFMHLSRQGLRKAIDYARESFPTPQAYLDDREQKCRHWRDEARALAPEYASFLNSYAQLLIKFKPGVLPASVEGDLLKPTDGWRNPPYFDQGNYNRDVEYFARHLRWRASAYDAYHGCSKCNKGMVQTRHGPSVCTCVEEFEARLGRLTDAEILRNVRCHPEALPAWMYDFIEARVDDSQRLVPGAIDHKTPTRRCCRVRHVPLS